MATKVARTSGKGSGIMSAPGFAFDDEFHPATDGPMPVITTTSELSGEAFGERVPASTVSGDPARKFWDRHMGPTWGIRDS